MTRNGDGRVKTRPNDLSAERALLGAFIMRPELMRENDLDPADLWRDDHRALYRLMLEMRATGEPIDLVTLPERVHRTGHPEKFGGVGYVMELPDFAPTANVEHYVRRVSETADHRRLMDLADGLLDAAASQLGKPSEIAEALRGKLATIGATASAEWVSLADAATKAEAELVRRQSAGMGMSGLSTGLRELDAILSGLCPGKLYLLAARPAMGKTGLALKLAEGMACDPHGKGAVGVYSMEMDDKELAERTIVGRTNLNPSAVRSGQLSADDWDIVTMAREIVSELPIFIQDKPSRTLADIVSSARRLEARGGVRGLVIDYLQLMDGPGDNQVLKIGAISAGLKGLAREMNIPIILLSQLNRECEKRSDKRPMMSDIRDSGSVEQDCDVIMFIYRHFVYYPEEVDKEGLAELIVRKQRAGPTGTVLLGYSKGHFDDHVGGAWL